MNAPVYIRRCLIMGLLLAALALTGTPFVLPAAQPGKRLSPPPARRALIISLDGLDARYLLKRDEYGLKIPTLRRLMQNGVTAEEVVGVYPSVTYPSHTTIVTGATPARHGIYGNEVFETPDRPQTGSWQWHARAIRAETLWDAAARRGLQTSLISWPVAVGAGAYNFPEIWKPGGTREESLLAIKANARPQGFVEELERRDGELYRNVTKDEGDDLRTRFAEYVISEKKTEVVLVHLFDLDHYQHDFGPFTPEAFAILEKVDGYVARMLSALERAGTLAETAVFIVSDHGFLPVSKQIHPGVILARQGLIRVRQEKDAQAGEKTVITDWRAVPYVNGASCAIILRDPKDEEAYQRVLLYFKAFANGEGRGRLRVLEGGEVNRLRTNPNAALILEAEEGYCFGNNYTGEAITSTKLRGQHGFLPSRYYTSFIASGAGVGRRGSLGTIRLIDEGPTIARVLGLKLRDAEGRALTLK